MINHRGPEFRALLPILQDVRGAESPDTLRYRARAANVLQHLGKSAQAEQELRAVIDLQQRVLGPEHPDVISSRIFLALSFNAEEKLSEAQQECAQLLPICLRVFNPQNTRVLTVRRLLAVTLALLKRYDEAEKQFLELLSIQEAMLRDKPDQRSLLSDIVLTLNLLAEVSTENKQWSDGARLLQRAIAISNSQAVDKKVRKKVLGNYLSLSWCQLHLGDFSGALASTDAGHKIDESDLMLETNRAHALRSSPSKAGSRKL